MRQGRLLVPLYVHPATDPGAWQALVVAAPQLYGVVLNVTDGPGRAPDPAFAAASRALREAGVRVLGYVDTAYGEREPGPVTDDVSRHRDWYGVDGCFLDRVAPGRGDLRRTRRLVRSARDEGASTVVLNPGVHPASGYAGAADLLVTFEGHWSTYLRAFDAPQWTARHSPEHFCHLVYGVPPTLTRLAARTALRRGAAVHCAVPGSGPNPWTRPPGMPAEDDEEEER
ncbi:spherulation-specific family 4 protein [Streptomyces sp. cg35]|uniref:spherulation-specific family 4 protein n=1 Tax=Streptomyces sp. cg35 TaxID=3421650 RepID=UPI003D169A46